MAFTTAYADSDADDEYERSVMTSPILHTDDDTSPTESDPPSTEPTPTFGKSDTERLSPGSLLLAWTTAQCADFISSLGPGLPQYREKFTENEIVGEALVALRNDELKEMGIVSVGHQITILKAVYDIKVKQGVPIEIDDYIPPSADASLRDQYASREDVSRIIQSIKLRDDRFAHMEQELQRVTEEYRKLRDELLPIFRMAKDRSQPLPFPAAASPDLQHHEDMMSPLVSQPPPERIGSSLSRKFSTKSLLFGSTPKSSSPTHVPQAIPENKPVNGNSNLDPSAAALAASSHLIGSMNGDNMQSATSPSRANLPSPTSPNTYISAPSQTTQRPYRDVTTPATARLNGYSNNEESLPHSVYSTTSTLVKPERDRSGPTPTPGSMSRSNRNPPREISTAKSGSNPASAPSSARNDVEIFKSFRVSMADPCEKVLPAALKEYDIDADPKQYALYIVFGDQEKKLENHHIPLVEFKDYHRQGLKPMFMLRKLQQPGPEANASKGREGNVVGGASDGGSISGGRIGGSQIQFPPGGVL